MHGFQTTSEVQLIALEYCESDLYEYVKKFEGFDENICRYLFAG